MQLSSVNPPRSESLDRADHDSVPTYAAPDTTIFYTTIIVVHRHRFVVMVTAETHTAVCKSTSASAMQAAGRRHPGHACVRAHTHTHTRLTRLTARAAMAVEPSVLSV